ncbi:MAG: LiaI-LiaF-like domain-containing protein [Terriglobia bacterium]
MAESDSNSFETRRKLTLPVMLIVVGVLFLLNQYAPGWGILRTWPVILIALGILLILRSFGPPRAPRGPSV